MKKRRSVLKIIITVLVLAVVVAAGVLFCIMQQRMRRAETLRLFAEAFGKTGTEIEETLSGDAEDIFVSSHVYSHRGSAGPQEHSFKAYDDAIAAGSRYIEQDLVLSSDGILFVSHDLNAAAMTGKNLDYASANSAKIDKLRTEAGDKILRLSEVFDRYGRDINYVIELKSSDGGTVKAFEDIVEQYGLQDRVTVQAVSDEVLEKIEEKIPDMPKLLVCKSQEDFSNGLYMKYVDILSVREESGLMTEANCAAAHTHGKWFSAWTLDSEDAIRRAIDMKVDTYFTNDTPLALKLEREYGIKERTPKKVDEETLFFASDYQNRPEWYTPAETLSAILKAVKKDGKTPTNVVYCGDYSNNEKLFDYQVSPDSSISEIRSIVAKKCKYVSQDDMIFEQGNHDRLTAYISESGLHEYDDYLIYVLNTQYDFPWKQGRSTEFKGIVSDAADKMKECFDELIEKGETRPVFIAGHVPLHFTARTSSKHTTGDNMYSSYIFNVVNKAAKSLDIIYVFGHNHSGGWDCYLGGSSVFRQQGDTILIPDAKGKKTNTDKYKAKTLNFTYMNAGYTGYYMNCGPKEAKKKGAIDKYSAADESLTGTVFEIHDDEIEVTRYSPKGPHPLGWDGEADPYKSGIDKSLISSKYYSKKVNSPAHIERQHS